MDNFLCNRILWWELLLTCPLCFVLSFLQAYVARGGLPMDIESMIAEDLARDYSKRLSTSSADTMTRRLSSMSGGGDNRAVESFSLTLLMHRWDMESRPRVDASLVKRFDLINISLSHNLERGLWLPNEDMGNKLMELREG